MNQILLEKKSVYSEIEYNAPLMQKLRNTYLKFMYLSWPDPNFLYTLDLGLLAP